MLNFENIVLVIGGNNLKTVASHNLKTNTWSVNLSQLNEARFAASACLLAGNAYVFAGKNSDTHLNSIEKIAADSLFSNGPDCWTLIKVPQDVFTPCTNTAVAPLNDTEIAILGGYNEGRLGDVLIFDTNTEKCVKVDTEGSLLFRLFVGQYKFFAFSNQCAKSGMNKVVAFVVDNDDGNPSVIEWTKGESAVTIIWKYPVEKPK